MNIWTNELTTVNRLSCKATLRMDLKYPDIAFVLCSMCKVIFLKVNKTPSPYPFGAIKAAAVNFTPLQGREYPLDVQMQEF